MSETTPVPMTPAQLAESRVALEKLVEERKRKIDSGEAPPLTSGAEIRAARLAQDNIVNIGDAIKEVLPKLQETMTCLVAHATKVREKIAELQPETCIEHPEQELPVNEPGTIGHSWHNEKFTVVYDPCPKCIMEKRQAAERAQWLDRGVPNKVLHATFDNYDTAGDPSREKALAKFRAQVKRGSGFILAVGKWGTGKTHLAVAAMKAKGSGLFVTEHDLIGELRQTYVENTGQDKMVERYQRAKVLVLDEVTPDVKGVDIAPLLYRVLGYRHDNDLLTVLTSNDELEVVLQILGPKLRDRMRENYTVANFIWESHRQPQKL